MSTLNLRTIRQENSIFEPSNAGIDRAAQSAMELWNRRAMVLLDECKTQFCQLRATRTTKHEDVRPQQKILKEKLNRSYKELGFLLEALTEETNEFN